MKKVLKNFQYVSDLHLEFRIKPVFWSVKSDTLLLAGDIGNPFELQYKHFLKFYSEKYSNVFLIAGNHEYWNPYGIHATNEKISDLCNTYNVHFLNQKVFSFSNVEIAGCTLWTYLSNLKLNTEKVTNNTNNREVVCSDLRNIYNNGDLITNRHRNALYKSDLNWLKSVISVNKQENKTETNGKEQNKETNKSEKLNKQKMIVLTHHLPTFKMCDKKYTDMQYRPYWDQYYNNLEHLVESPVTEWIGGHSHSKFNSVYNSVNLRINAVGTREDFPVPVVHLKD